MSACRRARRKSRPRRGARNHAFALATLVGPAHDAPRERLYFEVELAVALTPRRVFLLLVAVGQRSRVQLAQPIEHRIGVRIVDRFADLAVHHFLEVEVLGRRGAAEQRQENRDSPCFAENRECPYFAASCASIAASMRRAASGAASTLMSSAGASGVISRMRCCASSTGMSSLKTRTMSPEKSCSIVGSSRPKLRTKPKK